MSWRRLAKYILLGLVLVILFFAVTTRCPTIKQVQGSLGTTDEPLGFMARSIKPGMTRADVAQIVPGHYRFESLPPHQFAPGGEDVYHWHFQLGPRWKWLGEYESIWVHYDIDGHVIDAHTDVD